MTHRNRWKEYAHTFRDLRRQGKTYWEIREFVKQTTGKKISTATIYHWCHPKKYLTYRYHTP